MFSPMPTIYTTAYSFAAIENFASLPPSSFASPDEVSQLPG